MNIVATVAVVHAVRNVFVCATAPENQRAGWRVAVQRKGCRSRSAPGPSQATCEQHERRVSQNSVRLSPRPSHGMVPLQHPRQTRPSHSHTKIVSAELYKSARHRVERSRVENSHWVIFSVNRMQSPAFPSTRWTGTSASFQSACFCVQRLSAHCKRYWLPTPGISRSLA